MGLLREEFVRLLGTPTPTRKPVSGSGPRKIVGGGGRLSVAGPSSPTTTPRHYEASPRTPFPTTRANVPPTSRLSRLGALDKYLRGLGPRRETKRGFDVGKGEGPRTSRRGGSTFALVVGKIFCRLGKVDFADNHKGRTSLNQISGASEKGPRAGLRPD